MIKNKNITHIFLSEIDLSSMIYKRKKLKYLQPKCQEKIKIIVSQWLWIIPIYINEIHYLAG